MGNSRTVQQSLTVQNESMLFFTLVIAIAITAVDFGGVYLDPNHPDGVKVVSNYFGSKKSNYVTVIGSDDGLFFYTLAGETDGDNGRLVVDFSPKGGPSDFYGQFEEDKNAIIWQDGNMWQRTMPSNSTDILNKIINNILTN